MAKQKSKKYVEPIGLIILYLLIFFGCWKLADIIFEFLFKSFPYDTVNYLLNDWGLWVVFKFIMPISIIMLTFKFRKVNFFKFCKFKKMQKHDILRVLFISILGSLFTIHFSNTGFALKNIPEFNQYIIDATKGNFFSTYVVMGVILIFGEEILFRGLIFNEMRKFLPLVVVLFTHYLIYMPLNPNFNVAIFAVFNFLAYALVFVFVDSIWGSIMFQSIGAILLYTYRLIDFDIFIRKLGDGYLISATVICLALLIYNILRLRKAPLNEIFAIENKKNINLVEEI